MGLVCHRVVNLLIQAHNGSHLAAGAEMDSARPCRLAIFFALSCYSFFFFSCVSVVVLHVVGSCPLVEKRRGAGSWMCRTLFCR